MDAAASAAAIGLGALQNTSSPGTPPVNRGVLPPSQDGDRIDKFNNPNSSTFPSASSSLPRSFRNRIGYLTYVQFMMDHGRDLKPDDRTLVPLAKDHPDCPLHREGTAGGEFEFPPREQPTHAARRALIAAIDVVDERNQAVPSEEGRDQVAIITFDTLSGPGPRVHQPLTGDYQVAMQACTTIQAVGDKGATTATEAGLALAASQLLPRREGGPARDDTDKVCVLLTDGVPNLYTSSNSDIDNFMSGSSSPDFYGGGQYWYDAALMQAALMEVAGTDMYPVGIGLGTDYDFMDRMARMGATAGSNGQSARGSGNPTEYEERLIEIFEKIIKAPTARLVF
jgi:hypothetical protein